MGGEWAKAVKMIFGKKYSNGRGKLSDAMKDPETKAIHADMLGKKPVKMNNKMSKKMKKPTRKTKKYKKTMRGGQYLADNIQAALDDIEKRLNNLEGKSSVEEEKEEEEDDRE